MTDEKRRRTAFEETTSAEIDPASSGTAAVPPDLPSLTDRTEFVPEPVSHAPASLPPTSAAPASVGWEQDTKDGVSLRPEGLTPKRRLKIVLRQLGPAIAVCGLFLAWVFVDRMVRVHKSTQAVKVNRLVGQALDAWRDGRHDLAGLLLEDARQEDPASELVRSVEGFFGGPSPADRHGQ